MRRAARVDANQQAIIDALRGVGAKVWLIGKQLDALVWYKQRMYLVDFKANPKAHRTKSQRMFIDDGWPIYFWSSIDQALEEIGAVE